VYLICRYGNLKSFKKNPIQNLFIKVGAIIFLLVLFLQNIGSFPMSHNLYPYELSEQPVTYFFYFCAYIGVAALIVVESFFFDGYIKKHKKALIFILVCITLTIALVTFEPGFPIVGHDYSYFFGPIWEVIHGKTLYTQVPSQYGFVSILFIAFLYKLHLLNIFYLPALVWILYSIEYLLCFYMLYEFTDFLPLALTGLISIITLNYYSLFHLPATIPQTGPLRWLPLVIALFALHKFKKSTSKQFIFLISLLSLWVIDSGISLLLAYGFTLFLLFVNKIVRFRKVIESMTLLILSLTMVFFLINVIHLFLGYQLVNVVLVFAKLAQYGKAGFGMIPIDSKTYFWTVILVYFSSLFYFFRRGKNDYYDQLLLFSANLSFFASIYFVGRSHPHNLFHISLFPILNGFILCGLIIRRGSILKQKIIITGFLFLLCIVFPIYNRSEVMTLMIENKIKSIESGNIFTSASKKELDTKYKIDVLMIKKQIKDRQIVILSPDDTYLFYLTDKKNMMYDNSQFTILTNEDMDKSLSVVYKKCPSRIVADCTLFKKCEPKPFTSIPSFPIQPLLLKRIQDRCNTIYTAVECTSQLCIAEGIKK